MLYDFDLHLLDPVLKSKTNRFDPLFGPQASARPPSMLAWRIETCKHNGAMPRPAAIGTIDFPRAATMLQNYLTAIYTLTRRALVPRGEFTLAVGVGGGVSLAYVDVATSVIFAAKKRSLTSLGATKVINLDLYEVLRQARALLGLASCIHFRVECSVGRTVESRDS